MTDPDRQLAPDADDAAALIDRLRAFADELGPGQRQLLAALLAPGIDAAWRWTPGRSEVGWSRTALPEHLVAAVQHRRLRIVDD